MAEIETKSNLLTVKQVCERLSISRTLLHQIRRNGAIVPIIINNDAVRFTEEEVARFIKESAEKVN